MTEQFTAQDWILIIGAIGVVLSNVITNWRNTAKLDAVNATARVIEGHVNSATTKADERATAAADRERSLLTTIEELKRNSALLAQALAIRDAGRSIRTTDINSPIIVPMHTEQSTDSVETPKASKTEIKKIADNLEIKPKDGKK